MQQTVKTSGFCWQNKRIFFLLFFFLYWFQCLIAHVVILKQFDNYLAFDNIIWIEFKLIIYFAKRFNPWARQPNIIKWGYFSCNICQTNFMLLALSVIKAINLEGLILSMDYKVRIITCSFCLNGTEID